MAKACALPKSCTQLLWRCALACCWAAVGCGATDEAPKAKLQTSLALQLAGEPVNENLATKNQAMSVWAHETDSSKELVVALIHLGNMDRRADDQQFAVAWESDGTQMQEIRRLNMSCPDVELVVPSRGPYVYEARLTLSPYSLHPECSCQPAPGKPCPAGVLAVVNGVTTNLTSPIDSHFVVLENQWQELIADKAVLGRLKDDVDAPVVLVSAPVENAAATAGTDAAMACPASRDEPLGGPDVTKKELEDNGIKLPEGHVSGSWCLVRQGVCSETAKVKVCELSGAVGTIIIDHGNLQGDQEIRIRYNREASESARKPVLFISDSEGQQLANAAAGGGGASVRVGPSVAGPAPQGWSQGSGVVVHRIADAGGASKAYPDIFPTAGWLEVSDVRDIMFVCMPSGSEIGMYDVSQPLSNMPQVGVVELPCSRLGLHDYRVLDYRDQDGNFRTAFVDPADSGNRLYYYDTNDPSTPSLITELHITWEAENSGLGQVRPGGPDGRYHFVTWHCSTLYCGKNHGDSLYVIDSRDLLANALQVPLPMHSAGGFARDIACDGQGICLVTLTWDGLVAVDSGAPGTANQFTVVARAIGDDPFSSANIPYHLNHLRMWSGAQKVYASKLRPRRFYVEHANFELRPLRMGDAIRAFQLNEVYAVELKDYDETVEIEKTWWAPSRDRSRDRSSRRRDGGRREKEGGLGTTGTILLSVSLVAAVLVLACLAVLLLRSRKAAKRQQQQIDQLRQSSGQSVGGSVVVGRPVSAEAGAESEGGAPAATAGEPLQPSEKQQGP
eukprot:CAMPEP_0179062052 /NCGR_PEP_ID=MMETSP0796-20121207/26733_1 /TAXON_ID=73915 /ORGANISM="Pyrodinium bahamense, Strain pbaha01" /LENGTH=787 /DNA_ID=CAMNT_0020758955 /DNA_START=1 /DNA_END=2364 /DNA_ORIENTATION=-